MVSTPEQFAAKLHKSATGVVNAQHDAIKARANLTQRVMFATAASVSSPKNARLSWVKVSYPSKDSALLAVHGGFAMLFQRGSYKKPGGYTEVAKEATRRRIASAAKRGVAINTSGLMRTPYGAFPHVHHPAVAARPFFQQGARAADRPGLAAYRKVVDTAYTAPFH